jgi:hypothetical protein
MKRLTIALGAIAIIGSPSLFANEPMPSDSPSPQQQQSPGRRTFVVHRINHLRDKRHTEANFERLDRNASWLGIPSYQPSAQAQRQHLIDEVEFLALKKEQNGGHLGPRAQARLNEDLKKLGYR